jgi:uncharacterized SAM-dependent methyltransferase
VLKFFLQVMLTAVVLAATAVVVVVTASGVIVYAIYRHYHPRVALPPTEQVHRLILVDGRDEQ